MTSYQNGRIPLADLTVTSIGVRLRADAAASVERMAPRFRREVGHPLLASDGYRAMDGPWGQIWTFEDRYTSLVSLGVNDRRGPWIRSSHPSLGPRWWYRRANAAAAAVPGTSNHGWATACDFAAGINSAGTKAHRWMNEHGPEYGWIWPAWAQRHPTFEPWHREYDPARDQHRGSGGAAITPPTSEEDDMPTAAEVANAVLNTPDAALGGKTVHQVLAATMRTNGDINTVHQAVLRTPAATAQALLSTRIKRAGLGKGETTLAAVLAWTDDYVMRALNATAQAGGTIDMAQVAAAVKAAADAALGDVELTLTTKGGAK